MRMRDQEGRDGQGGMGMVEVVASTALMALALVGLLAAVLSVSRMNEDTRTQVLGLSASRRLMEDVHGTSFSTIYGIWNNYAFDVPGLVPQDGDADGRVGLVTVDNSNPQLLVLNIAVQWKCKTGNRSFTLTRKLVDERGGVGWGAKSNGSVGGDDPSQEAAPGAGVGASHGGTTTTTKGGSSATSMDKGGK